MSRRNPEAGIALIAVILILALMLGLAAGFTTVVTMDTSLRGAFTRTTTGFYAAESGLNRGMGDYRNIFLNFRVPTGTDYAAHSISVGSRTVSYQLQAANPDAFGNATPQTVQIPVGQLFGGLNSTEYDYIVSSSAVNTNSDTEANVSAEFAVGNIPLFQFVAFYNNDLEIMPGADMHLHGRVHTNGELYVNSDAHLWIEDNQGPNVTPAGLAQNLWISTVQVTARGSVHRGRKDTTVCAGTVTVDMYQDIVSPTPDLDPQDISCIGGASAVVPVSTLSSWKGSIVSQVQSISVPQPGIIVKGPGNRFWTSADLRIVLVMNQNGQLPGANSPILPNSIIVQNADGSTDAVKTPILQAFMADRAWNQAANTALVGSSMPGTMPIFYTDVPATQGACNCNDATPGCTNTRADCYPKKTIGAAQYYMGSVPPTVAPGNNGPADRVYGVGLAGSTTLMLPTTAAVSDANLPPYLDYRRGGFYSRREQKWMYLLNVNIADLLEWNRNRLANGFATLFDPADTTDGGLVIFLSVQGPESLTLPNRYGVRVFGSANLSFPAVAAGGDPTGVTVVSDQAMYVVGDYNRGNTAALDLPWQPAALIGDSVNVLSNGWFAANGNAGLCVVNDCQSSLSLANRPASNPVVTNAGAGTNANPGNNIYINAAFLGGVDTTASGNYNGGLENYPRFHEDWGVNGGQTLNYRGSFVSLGTPAHVNGAWCGTGNTCNIYNPPKRNYDYDARFNTVANLPPLTPEFIYVQQILFTENFK